MKLNLCLGFTKSKYRIYPIKIFLGSSSRTCSVQFGAENGFSLRRASLPINFLAPELFFLILAHPVYKM